MIVYRRSEEEMPARIEEVKHQEGIEFLTLHNPLNTKEMKKDTFGKFAATQRLGDPTLGRRRLSIEGDMVWIEGRSHCKHRCLSQSFNSIYFYRLRSHPWNNSH